MRFTPKTEDQVKKITLLKSGLADYEILGAEETVSKAGKEMLHLKLKVWDVSGQQGVIHDYILNNEAFEYKLRHLCYSCGLGDVYESGELTDSQLNGRSGKLDIGIQKDKTGQYPDKNNVKDYIAFTTANYVPESAKQVEEFDDEVPF